MTDADMPMVKNTRVLRNKNLKLQIMLSKQSLLLGLRAGNHSLKHNEKHGDRIQMSFACF